MTNQIESNVENTASDAALAQKGKVVRATGLKAGTTYVMSVWNTPKVYSVVTFIGFGRSKDALLASIPQLKTLTVNDKFFFRSGDETLVADGRCPGNVFIGEGAGLRCTFFELLNATTAAVTAQPETQTPVATPAEGAADAVAEQATAQFEVTNEEPAFEGEESPAAPLTDEDMTDALIAAQEQPVLAMDPRFEDEGEEQVAETVEVQSPVKASKKGKGKKVAQPEVELVGA